MQFLFSVIFDGASSASSDEMEKIDAFNDKLRAHGHWVYANGMHDPQDATVIDNRNGAGLTTHGPLNDTAEYAIGMWIIEAPSHDVALALAAEGSEACNRKVEVRPLH